ncbi:hypothetical protein HDA44_001063 [Kribbella solani]|uniref:Uncharacterized protein n=1 Tax=Kribbella solani TaxID=236067 RepID=A0A841DGU2_9ACTN|nr:hypothetical protein [Kribbella solani]
MAGLLEEFGGADQLLSGLYKVTGCAGVVAEVPEGLCGQ